MGKTTSELAASKAYRWTIALLRGLGWALVGLFIVSIFLSVLLLYPVVQTGLAGFLSDQVSERYGVDLRVERLELRPFGPVRLHGVHIKDLDGDTLLDVATMNIAGLRYYGSINTLRIRDLEVRDARFSMRTETGGTRSNLTLFLERFASSDTTSSGEDLTITCRKFLFDELHYSFHDPGQERIPFGMDFRHVDVREAHIAGTGLSIIGDSIEAHLSELRLKEHCGLELDRLSGDAVVSRRGIHLDDLELLTKDSYVKGTVHFTTESYDDLSYFEEKVDMRLDLDSSRVEFAEIALFAPGLQGVQFPVTVSGRVRGTIADMKARDLDLRFGRRSHFIGDVELTGLPDIDNTFMVIDAGELLTDHQDIAQMPRPPFITGKKVEVPAEIQRLGTIDFSGNFTGFLSSFTAYGTTRTDIGELRTDLSYERRSRGEDFTVKGRLASASFDLGKLLDTRTLGPLTCDIRVQAAGSDLASLNGDLEGEIPMITLNRYAISNIRLDGHLEKNLFDGNLSCDDPNLEFDFKGSADLRDKWPLVDFTANVQHADLMALNFVDSTGYSSLNLFVKAKGVLDPDEYQGTLDLIGISYCSLLQDHELGDVHLSSGVREGRSLLTLDSDIAQAEVLGIFRPTQLPQALRSVLFSVFPALEEDVPVRQEEQRFEFHLTTRNTEEVFALFAPDLHIAPDATFEGHLDLNSYDIGLYAELPHLSYGAFSSDSVTIILDKSMDVLAFSMNSARHAMKDTTFISGVYLSGKAYQDELDLRLGWKGSSNGSSGQLELTGEVLGPRAVVLDLQPSRLFFGRGNWVNERVAHLRVDSSTIAVEGLLLRNGEQSIRLEGQISEVKDLPMRFEFANVAMENFHPLLGGPLIHGTLHGDGRAYDLYNAPYLVSRLQVDDLAIEENPVGDVRFDASWNDGQSNIDVKGSITKDGITSVAFDGKVRPGAEDELDLVLDFDDLDLAFLNQYITEGVSEIGGKLTGHLDLGGTLMMPRLVGMLDLSDAGLRIDYLGTRYTFDHKVMVQPDMFALDFVKLVDEEGHTATAIGTILHEGLSQWNYNVSLEMEELLTLNTTVLDNSLFYGKAYATGDLEISGHSGTLEITVNARTGRGTDISLPLGGSTEVSSIDYVRFITHSADSMEQEQVVDLSGVALDLNVEVTDEAEFRLIFDPTVGDIMTGRGRGDLRMTVTPSGEFAMYGELEVVEGEYLFTLRNILNKRFDMVPGGRIVWYGDPLNAQLDLSAIYRLRAPLFNIMVERNDVYRKRVPVEVTMHLTDRLVNPGIAYDVRLPTVDEDVRSRVNAVISTPQELNRQVFSLIVLNNFTPPPDASGAGNGISSGSVAGTTGGELLSNQVSNWLSGLSNSFDLGLNYRPGDNITQEEVELAVSTQLFSDRLLLNTTVGVQYGAQSTNAQNTLIGDVQVEYLLTPDGKLRLKAYNQSNDQNLNRANQADYTQGVGLGYREDFNTFHEFWQKLGNIFRRSENDKTFE